MSQTVRRYDYVICRCAIGEHLSTVSSKNGANVSASDYDTLRTQARELAEELRKLANEASGFEAMSSDAHHGYTNKLILRARVEEARAVLAKAQAVLKEGA